MIRVLSWHRLPDVLSNTGRHDEAFAIMQQAVVLDPLSLILGAICGQFLYHAGRDSESIEQFKVILGMEPRFWVGQICAAKVYEKVGMYSEALVACDRAWEFSGGNTEALSIAGYVYAVSGNKARQWCLIRCVTGQVWPSTTPQKLLVVRLRRVLG